jgi:hypothetical protein
MQGAICRKSKTKMKTRHSNHKQEVKKQIRRPEGCGYENLTLTIIEQVEHKNLNFLAEREVF